VSADQKETEFRVFEGTRYRKVQGYWKYSGRLLHRVVWEHHRGPIPAGMHIHHIDGNRGNSDIFNLEMVSASDHQRHHMQNPNRWHLTEAGRANQRRLAEMRRGPAPKKFPVECVECGKSHLSTKRTTQFCGGTCRMRAHRRAMRASAA
jgi:hypothetical protein